jgi:hypothetical protein
MANLQLPCGLLARLLASGACSSERSVVLRSNSTSFAKQGCSTADESMMRRPPAAHPRSARPASMHLHAKQIEGQCLISPICGASVFSRPNSDRVSRPGYRHVRLPGACNATKDSHTLNRQRSAVPPIVRRRCGRSAVRRQRADIVLARQGPKAGGEKEALASC